MGRENLAKANKEELARIEDSSCLKKFYRITVKRLWWQNERRLTDWLDASTPEGVPLPSYRYGRRRGAYTQDYSSEGIILMWSKSACQSRLAM